MVQLRSEPAYSGKCSAPQNNASRCCRYNGAETPSCGLSWCGSKAQVPRTPK